MGQNAIRDRGLSDILSMRRELEYALGRGGRFGPLIRITNVTRYKDGTTVEDVEFEESEQTRLERIVSEEIGD
jgi:hypothetical protein